MALTALPTFIRNSYKVAEWKSATAVLATDFPAEWAEMIQVLTQFRLLRSEIVARGGGLSKISQRINKAFKKEGWKERKFNTKIVIDETELAAPTHKVDCFKNSIALELEWNNKTEFYDRDLNNFRLLFDLRVVSVGIIITRSTELDGVLRRLGRYKSYGASTTHMDKLLPRLEGGSGGGCPVLAFGITEKVYVDDIAGGHVGKAHPRSRKAKSR
jgi:Restriction endonuclease BglII